MNHSRLRFLLPFVLTCLVRVFAQTVPAVPGAAQTVQVRLGYPASARLLVIHADDLGMNHSVNRAIFEALDKGWVTSASILVPCPWFPEVVKWAKEHPSADLGIHQALNSEWTTLRWGPVSPKDKVPSLLDSDGYLPLDTPEVAQNAKLSEVESELHAQIDRAQSAGIHLTHLDSHMGALFESNDLYKVYQKMGYSYTLPILEARAGSHSAKGTLPPEEEVLVEKVIEIEPGVDAKDWAAWYRKQLEPLVQACIRSLCISRMTTKRCEVLRSIIRIGAQLGDSMIWIWLGVRNSAVSQGPGICVGGVEGFSESFAEELRQELWQMIVQVAERGRVLNPAPFDDWCRSCRPRCLLEFPSFRSANALRRVDLDRRAKSEVQAQIVL